MDHTCPVCGYVGLYEPPRSLETGAGSDEICPSCGFQFGFDDDDRGISYEQWRQKWRDSGMRWFSTGRKPPDGWDPSEQLARVLRETSTTKE